MNECGSCERHNTFGACEISKLCVVDDGNGYLINVKGWQNLLWVISLVWIQSSSPQVQKYQEAESTMYFMRRQSCYMFTKSSFFAPSIPHVIFKTSPLPPMPKSNVCHIHNPTCHTTCNIHCYSRMWMSVHSHSLSHSLSHSHPILISHSNRPKSLING